MIRGRIFALTGVAALVGLAVACASDPLSPTNPSAAGNLVSSHAAADGSTLKVLAPELVSPINGTKPVQGLELTVKNATATFPAGSKATLSYRFEIYDTANNRVYESTLVPGGANGTTVHSPSANLTVDANYTWQARAEYQGAVGPWPKEKAKFVASLSSGFIRGTEIYDPLIDGKTVGTIHGHVTFIPGVGAKIEDDESWIEYVLASPLTGGEMSGFVSNLRPVSNTEDPKYRVFTMRQGSSAMNDNPYRMSVDKRGNGAVAYRFITGDLNPSNYIESGSPDRPVLPFQASVNYFWRVTWGGNVFNYSINEDTTTGKLFYNLGNKAYKFTYAPNPHVVYIGSPWVAGDRGEAASVAGMIVKQLWVSSNPRPGYANR